MTGNSSHFKTKKIWDKFFKCVVNRQFQFIYLCSDFHFCGLRTVNQAVLKQIIETEDAKVLCFVHVWVSNYI